MGSTVSRKVTTRSKRGPVAARSASPQVVERYTPRRRALFLLENAVGAADYAAARREVRKLGLDPDSILHDKPAGM